MFGNVGLDFRGKNIKVSWAAPWTLVLLTALIIIPYLSGFHACAPSIFRPSRFDFIDYRDIVTCVLKKITPFLLLLVFFQVTPLRPKKARYKMPRTRREKMREGIEFWLALVMCCVGLIWTISHHDFVFFIASTAGLLVVCWIGFVHNLYLRKVYTSLTDARRIQIVLCFLLMLTSFLIGVFDACDHRTGAPCTINLSNHKNMAVTWMFPYSKGIFCTSTDGSSHFFRWESVDGYQSPTSISRWDQYKYRH